MKSTITISLDTELIQLLKKQDNYSNMINEQLNNFLNSKGTKNINFLQENLEKKRIEMKKLRKEIRELMQEISEINKKQREIFEIAKKKVDSILKPHQISWLKTRNNLDWESAKDFVVKEGLQNFGIGPLKLIKIWEDNKDVWQKT